MEIKYPLTITDDWGAQEKHLIKFACVLRKLKQLLPENNVCFMPLGLEYGFGRNIIRFKAKHPLFPHPLEITWQFERGRADCLNLPGKGRRKIANNLDELVQFFNNSL